MKKVIVFVYGSLSYLLFLFTFIYAIGFVGNIVVPKGMDGKAQMDLVSAVVINLGLLSIFAVQHSVMARPMFKQWLTRFIPEPAERSTYVLCSSIALLMLFYYWQPLGGVVWQFENPLLMGLMWMGFGFGWLLVLVATFFINHFDLFGLRQVWLFFKGKPYSQLPFSTPGFYRYIRHPLYLGWFFAFWCTPLMTVTHLLFAVVTSIYILLAIRWEEHDLCDALGDDYVKYRKKVPMLLPFGKH